MVVTCFKLQLLTLNAAVDRTFCCIRFIIRIPIKTSLSRWSSSPRYPGKLRSSLVCHDYRETPHHQTSFLDIDTHLERLGNNPGREVVPPRCAWLVLYLPCLWWCPVVSSFFHRWFTATNPERHRRRNVLLHKIHKPDPSQNLPLQTVLEPPPPDKLRRSLVCHDFREISDRQRSLFDIDPHLEQLSNNPGLEIVPP